MSSKGTKRAELLAALDQEMRKMSAQSVLLSQAVADRVGMNSTDLECLDVLNLMGPIPAGRLAEITGLTTGAVTGLVDRLERAGYVRRENDPGDRRRVIIQPIPEAGRKKIAPHFKSMAQAMAELYSRYTREELTLILDFATRSNEVTREEIAKLRVEVEDVANPKRDDA